MRWMRAVRTSGVAWLSLVSTVGCGEHEDKDPDVQPPKQEALTHVQVAAARQAGLLPSEYLVPTFFDLPSGATGNTKATRINSAGLVIGDAGPQPQSYPDGSESVGFYATASSGTATTPI